MSMHLLSMCHEARLPRGAWRAGASVAKWPPLVVLLAVAGVLTLSSPHDACAEPSADEKASASVLFQEGRRLMAEGRTAEACPKLEESQRLDPGGGTLLNLALCHELDGRLMRAWNEFKEAASVARRDGRRDRESEAESHISSIEPRLSRLTIVVPAGTRIEGLVVERDGHEVGPGAWSTGIPVDGGVHVVRATAPGREPFITIVEIGRESDHHTVEIPVLATPVVVVSQPRVASPALPLESPPPRTRTFTPSRLRWAGIGSASAGVLMLATSGYVLASALEAKQSSNSECFVDGCTEIGLQKRRDAVSRGNTATILGIGGALLVGAGVTFLYLAHRSTQTTKVGATSRSSPQNHEAGVSVRLLLGAAPGTVVAGIGGSL